MLYHRTTTRYAEQVREIRDWRRAAVILVTLILLLVIGSTTSAQQSPLRLSVTVNWYLGLQVGVEYRPWPHVGFSADVGTSVFSLEGDFVLTYNGLLMLYAFPPTDSFQLNACIGVLNAMTVFTDPVAGELPIGAAIQVGYAATDWLELFFRVGEAVPFYWEPGRFERDEVRFPLGLWPDLSMGGRFSP